MAKRKISLKQQQNSQAAQIKRIQKMIDDMRQSGFEFKQSFLNSLKVSGTTPSAAKKKAERLRGISKTDLYNQVSSYRTDSGKLWTGPAAGKRGRLMEQRKQRRARHDLTGLDNVETELLNLEDSFYYAAERTDMSVSKLSVLEAWRVYRENIEAAGFITNAQRVELGRIIELCHELEERYQAREDVYNNYERIFAIVSGGQDIQLSNLHLSHYEIYESDLDE